MTIVPNQQTIISNVVNDQPVSLLFPNSQSPITIDPNLTIIIVHNIRSMIDQVSKTSLLQATHSKCKWSKNTAVFLKSECYEDTKWTQNVWLTNIYVKSYWHGVFDFLKKKTYT